MHYCVGTDDDKLCVGKYTHYPQRRGERTPFHKSGKNRIRFIERTVPRLPVYDVCRKKRLYSRWNSSLLIVISYDRKRGGAVLFVDMCWILSERQ